MRLGALFSGGKDSTYAMILAQKQGHEIVCLLNMHSENLDSYMFHGVNAKLTGLQAEALGIPLIIGSTKGVKEEELEDLEFLIARAKEEFGIQGVTAGAIASNYQKVRVEKICKKLGLELIAPFWGREPEEVIREMRANGMRFIIIKVAAEGLSEAWLGREVDEKAIDELSALNKKHGLHMTFEGGEAETFTIDCPIFSKPIKILKTKRHWDVKSKSGWMEIQDAVLEDRHLSNFKNK